MNVNKKLVLTICVVLLAASLIAPSVWAAKAAKIQAGKTQDVNLGNAGVTFAKAFYSGTVYLKRFSQGLYNGGVPFTFTQRLLDVRFYDSEGIRHRLVTGPVYVFFVVNNREIKKYNQDLLSIYFFDTWKGRWTKCPTYLLEVDGQTRAVCRIHAYGLFGVGVEGGYKVNK